MRFASEADPLFVDLETSEPDDGFPHGLWGTLAWFAGLFGLSMMFGFIIALTIFFLLFFRRRAGLSWQVAALYSVLGVAAIIGFGATLGRDFPTGLLQEFVVLPWPLT